MLPLYGCVSGSITSVLSVMTWGSVFVGFLFVRPWVLVNFLFSVHPLTWLMFWRHCYGGLFCSSSFMW